MQRRHHDCRISTAALPTTRCSEVGHVASTKTTEGQTLQQPGGAEENSRFREGDRHLRLAYDDDEKKRLQCVASMYCFDCLSFQVCNTLKILVQHVQSYVTSVRQMSIDVDFLCVWIHRIPVMTSFARQRILGGMSVTVK